MPRRNVRGTRWTAEDENILIDEIGKNPTCMKASFLAASAHLHRSPAAIGNHWYKYMAGREDVIAKLTIGRHAVVANRIRLKSEQEPTAINRSIFDRLVARIFRIGR